MHAYMHARGMGAALFIHYIGCPVIHYSLHWLSGHCSLAILARTGGGHAASAAAGRHGKIYAQSFYGRVTSPTEISHVDQLRNDQVRN